MSVDLQPICHGPEIVLHLICSQLEGGQVHESTFQIKMVLLEALQVTNHEQSYRPMLNEKQRGQLDRYVPFIEVIILQLCVAAAEQLHHRGTQGESNGSSMCSM